MRPISHILVVNGIKVRQPVFVVGAPHSGADLLARALKGIPGFHLTTGRGDVFRIATAFARTPSLAEQQGVGAARVLRDAFARAWQVNPHACQECAPECRLVGGVTALGTCVQSGQVSRFGDGTCELLYSADVLADAFPDAKLVQLIRDGHDVVCDMLADRDALAWLRPGLADVDTRLPNPFLGVWDDADRRLWHDLSIAGKCAMRWRGAVRTSARLRREIPEESLMTVRYEELAGDPAGMADDISEFLGTRVPAAALERHRTAEVGAWRNRLLAAQVTEIERAAGKELARLGYVRSRPRAQPDRHPQP